MDRFSTFFWSHLIFSVIEQLSRTLQAKNINIHNAVESARLAKTYLERQRSEESFERFYTVKIGCFNNTF